MLRRNHSAPIRADYRQPPIQFRFSDYCKADLSKADIIVAYLFSLGMDDIVQLLTSASAKRRPPTLISNTFSLPGMQPDRRIQSGYVSLSTVYVYRSASKPLPQLFHQRGHLLQRAAEEMICTNVALLAIVIFTDEQSGRI